MLSAIPTWSLFTDFTYCIHFIQIELMYSLKGQLLPFNCMFSLLIHIVPCIKTILCWQMNISYCIYSLSQRHRSCLYILANMNKADMNITFIGVPIVYFQVWGINLKENVLPHETFWGNINQFCFFISVDSFCICSLDISAQLET